METISATAARQFEDLVLPHLDAAYNLARWLTRNPADAEDIVQEAYLRALKYSHGLQTGDGRAWLLKIVRNAAYTWMKKNRRPEVHIELVDVIVEDGSKGPELRLLENAERERLRQALRGLPASLREVMVLRHLEDLSYKEISALIDCPIGTVMSRLSRARQAVIKAIKPDTVVL